MGRALDRFGRIKGKKLKKPVSILRFHLRLCKVAGDATKAPDPVSCLNNI